MNPTIIVQARMTSTRLPGKVLKKIAGKPILEHLLLRLNRSNTVKNVVVATTGNADDDVIVKLCDEMGVLNFRGSEHNVLNRYFSAAHFFNADPVVRINSDCPLIDPEIIDQVVSEYQNSNGTFDYVSNILEPSFPIGMHTEIFSIKALDIAEKFASLPEEREHVTPYIYRNPDKFKLKSVRQKLDESHIRLTLDTEADFELVSLIYGHLYFKNEKFKLEDVRTLLKNNPEWIKINTK